MLAIRHAVMFAIVGASLSVLAVKPVHAFEDGKDLLEAASAQIGSSLNIGFLTYVKGVVDGTRFISALYQMSPPFCVADSASVGDTTDVVRRFLEHVSVYGFGTQGPQELLDLPAHVVVVIALENHFRCRQ